MFVAAIGSATCLGLLDSFNMATEASGYLVQSYSDLAAEKARATSGRADIYIPFEEAAAKAIEKAQNYKMGLQIGLASGVAISGFSAMKAYKAFRSRSAMMAQKKAIGVKI